MRTQISSALEHKLISIILSPKIGPIPETRLITTHRCNMKCRPGDIGKYAGAITADYTFLLVPGGKIAANGLARKQVHTCIALYDTMEEAIDAVQEAWLSHGARLSRDYVLERENAPIGAIFVLEEFKNDFYLNIIGQLLEKDKTDMVATGASVTESNERSVDVCDDECPF